MILFEVAVRRAWACNLDASLERQMNMQVFSSIPLWTRGVQAVPMRHSTARRSQTPWLRESESCEKTLPILGCIYPADVSVPPARLVEDAGIDDLGQLRLGSRLPQVRCI